MYKSVTQVFWILLCCKKFLPTSKTSIYGNYMTIYVAQDKEGLLGQSKKVYVDLDSPPPSQTSNSWCGSYQYPRIDVNIKCNVFSSQAREYDPWTILIQTVIERIILHRYHKSWCISISFKRNCMAVARGFRARRKVVGKSMF